MTAALIYSVEELLRGRGARVPREQDRSGIYALVNAATDKVYIGQASIFRRRWFVHINALESGTHQNGYLQLDYGTYGRGAFSFEILEYVDDGNFNYIDRREGHWVGAYRRKGVLLYNIGSTSA